MSEITVYLSKKLLINCDCVDLEKKIEESVRNLPSGKNVRAKVSDVVSTKPEVSLNFRDFSATDFEDIQEVVDEVIDRIVFYFGISIAEGVVGVTIHSTVAYQIEVELP